MVSEFCTSSCITLLVFYSEVYLPSTNDYKIDEWKNFEERTSTKVAKEKMELTRQWVSYRGQTLARTGLNSEDFCSCTCNLHFWMLTRLSCGHIYISQFFSSERDDVL